MFSAQNFRLQFLHNYTIPVPVFLVKVLLELHTRYGICKNQPERETPAPEGARPAQTTNKRTEFRETVSSARTLRLPIEDMVMEGMAGIGWGMNAIVRYGRTIGVGLSTVGEVDRRVQYTGFRLKSDARCRAGRALGRATGSTLHLHPSAMRPIRRSPPSR